MADLEDLVGWVVDQVTELVDLVDTIHSDLLADLQGLVLLWALGWLLLLPELQVLVYLVFGVSAGSPFSNI